MDEATITDNSNKHRKKRNGMAGIRGRVKRAGETEQIDLQFTVLILAVENFANN